MDNNKDKSSHKKINVLLDHTNAGSMEWKVQVFKERKQEDWIKWKLHFKKLEMAMPLDSAPKTLSMV